MLHTMPKAKPEPEPKIKRRRHVLLDPELDDQILDLAEEGNRPYSWQLEIILRKGLAA